MPLPDTHSLELILAVLGALNLFMSLSIRLESAKLSEKITAAIAQHVEKFHAREVAHER